jgi:hypothetical protein
VVNRRPVPPSPVRFSQTTTSAPTLSAKPTENPGSQPLDAEEDGFFITTSNAFEETEPAATPVRSGKSDGRARSSRAFSARVVIPFLDDLNKIDVAEGVQVEDGRGGQKRRQLQQHQGEEIENHASASTAVFATAALTASDFFGRGSTPVKNV